MGDEPLDLGRRHRRRTLPLRLLAPADDGGEVGRPEKDQPVERGEQHAVGAVELRVDEAPPPAVRIAVAFEGIDRRGERGGALCDRADAPAFEQDDLGALD